MTPERLLTQLRKSGVSLYTEDDRLKARGPVSGLDPAVLAAAQEQRHALMKLIYAAFWPEGRPRPNVLDLALVFGARAVDEAFRAVGCDLKVRNPSLEDLFVVAERLGWTGPKPREPWPDRVPGPPPWWFAEAAPALFLKASTGMTDEDFSAFCRRTIGRPGPSTLAEDHQVAEALLAEEREPAPVVNSPALLARRRRT